MEIDSSVRCRLIATRHGGPAESSTAARMETASAATPMSKPASVRNIFNLLKGNDTGIFRVCYSILLPVTRESSAPHSWPAGLTAAKLQRQWKFMDPPPRRDPQPAAGRLSKALALRRSVCLLEVSKEFAGGMGEQTSTCTRTATAMVRCGRREESQ